MVVRESYRDRPPCFDAAGAAQRLLSGIPPKYLIGLKTVVLTDAAGLSLRERRRKTQYRSRRIRIGECRGLYHHGSRNEPAWIEIFVDNTTQYFLQAPLKIPLLADIVLGEVLFHEIGHHIHTTQSPEFRETEDVAEDWKKRLDRLYFRKVYWYLLPIVYLFYPVIKLRRWYRKKRKSRQKRND